jgi:hypothetical protein
MDCACRYKKEYKTVAELKHRFATFLESVQLVEKHNREKHSYTLAVNGMSLNLAPNIRCFSYFI